MIIELLLNVSNISIMECKVKGKDSPAAMMYGIINAISVSMLFLVQGGSDLTVGVPGLAGFVAMSMVIVIVWLYDRNHDRIMEGGILQ